MVSRLLCDVCLFVLIRLCEEMKSSKSTQTVQRRQSTAVESDGLPDASAHDPLATAAERIVQTLRAVEDRIVKSFGVAGSRHQDVAVGGFTGTLTDENLDRYVRYRVAAVTSAALREAEASIVEELVRISQLVPHGSDGFTYPRAQWAKHPALSSGQPDEGAPLPLIVERPTVPALLEQHRHGGDNGSEATTPSSRRGVDVLKVVQNSQRRKQVLDFEELDDADADIAVPQSANGVVVSPPRSLHHLQQRDSAAVARETHYSRMLSLAALSQTLQQPPGISFGDVGNVDAFLTSSRSFPSKTGGGFPQHEQRGALRSTRAQTYANVLQRAMLGD